MESPCSFIKQRYAYLARMIAKTRKTGNEHAYSICISPRGESGALPRLKDSAYIMGECSGKRCSVHPVPCPKDSVRSVNHTHPGPKKGADDFSIADFYSGIAVDAPFDCLYSTADHHGKCVVYKPFLTKDDLDFLQGCRKVERNARQKVPGEWSELLKKCYKQIPDLVGESECEYSLKTRTKWTKKTGYRRGK